MGRNRRLVPEHFNPRGKPKMAFPTRQKAIEYIARSEGSFRTYQCSLCKQWHLATIR